MNYNDLVLETRKLKIVPIDLDFKWVIFNNFTEEITKYMYPQPTGKIEDTIKFISSSMVGLENGTNLQMVIISKRRDEFLGCVGLHNLLSKKPEIGIWIKKEAHGCGYGLEAVSRII